MNRWHLWLLAWLLLTPFGSQAQARLVADLRTQPQARSSSPSGFTALGDRIFFFTDDQELWVTDDSAAGAHLVREMRVGTTSSAPAPLVAFGGYVYFVLADG